MVTTMAFLLGKSGDSRLLEDQGRRITQVNPPNVLEHPMPVVRAPSSPEEDLIVVRRLSAEHQHSLAQAFAGARNPLIKAIQAGIVLKVVEGMLIVAVNLNSLDDPRFYDDGSASLQRLISSVATQDHQDV